MRFLPLSDVDLKEQELETLRLELKTVSCYLQKVKELKQTAKVADMQHAAETQELREQLRQKELLLEELQSRLAAPVPPLALSAPLDAASCDVAGYRAVIAQLNREVGTLRATQAELRKKLKESGGDGGVDDSVNAMNGVSDMNGGNGMNVNGMNGGVNGVNGGVNGCIGLSGVDNENGMNDNTNGANQVNNGMIGTNGPTQTNETTTTTSTSLNPGNARLQSLLRSLQQSLHVKSTVIARQEELLQATIAERDALREEAKRGDCNDRVNSPLHSPRDNMSNLTLPDPSLNDSLVGASTEDSLTAMDSTPVEESEVSQTLQKELETTKQELQTVQKEKEKEMQAIQEEKEKQMRGLREEMQRLQEEKERQMQVLREEMEKNMQAIEEEKEKQIQLLREDSDKQIQAIQDKNRQIQAIQEEKNNQIQAVQEKQSQIQTLQDNQTHLLSITQPQFAQLRTSIQQIEKQLAADESFMRTLLKTLSKTLSSHFALVDNRLFTQRQQIARLRDQLQESTGSYRVMVRARPLLAMDACKTIAVHVMNDATLQIQEATHPMKQFVFDRVFSPTASQESVFAEVEPVVMSIFRGINACIIAYGQTGSGKTYSMIGESTTPGIVSRSCRVLFEEFQFRKDAAFSLQLSVCELYCEALRDLLNGGAEVPFSSSTVSGVAWKHMGSEAEVVSLLAKATALRATAETKLNERSSRSHMLVTMLLMDGERQVAKLTLVDLAGSENLKRSGAENERKKEAQNINLSLFELTNVLRDLATPKRVPTYRNSKLTMLLRVGEGEGSHG